MSGPSAEGLSNSRIETGAAVHIFLDFISRVLKPRHKDWRERDGLMYRWNGTAWESRPATDDDLDEAEWWQAIR